MISLLLAERKGTRGCESCKIIYHTGRPEVAAQQVHYICASYQLYGAQISLHLKQANKCIAKLLTLRIHGASLQDKKNLTAGRQFHQAGTATVTFSSISKILSASPL